MSSNKHPSTPPLSTGAAVPAEAAVEPEMTLTEHLVELRKRLIYAVISVAAGFGLSFNFSEKIFEVLRGPILPFLEKSGSTLNYTAIAEKFMTHVKVSVLAGFILTTPLWLYQVWAFVAPGLYKKEKKYIGIFIVFGSVLFITGVLFAYYLALPSAFEYLINFGGDADKPMITISEYLSFFTMTVLIFGAAFEMPLILMLLGIIGLIDAEFLKKNWRFAIVIMSVLAAIFSPPDAMSMLLVLVPMTSLYGLSILLMQIFLKKKAEEV